MPGKPSDHFGKQLRRERLARGWSLEELSKRTQIVMSHLSRIENGKRPPTQNIALACDRAFPERKGYFIELYMEMRTWMLTGFRDWSEHEEQTLTLRDWSPNVITGVLQTEAYARCVLETFPGASVDQVAARLATRMERQRKLFARDVRAWYLIDEPSLSRLAGSPEIMIRQMDHLLEVASRPLVTVQLLPAIVHPAGASGFVIADTAAYVEHVSGGYVYTEPETITKLDILFDTLRAECRRASESIAVIREKRDTWKSGEKAATAMPTGETA